jgi:hypothetical protein
VPEGVPQSFQAVPELSKSFSSYTAPDAPAFPFVSGRLRLDVSCIVDKVDAGMRVCRPLRWSAASSLGFELWPSYPEGREESRDAGLVNVEAAKVGRLSSTSGDVGRDECVLSWALEVDLLLRSLRYAEFGGA